MVTLTRPRAAAIDGGGRFVCPRADFQPAYLRTWEAGDLDAKVEAARNLLRPCRVCPRPCRDVDRLADEVGACRIGRDAVVASAHPHHGEEDPLRGRRGSGTVFFAGCNLRCVFCQNHDISQGKLGATVGPRDLAHIMVGLQTAGCHNVNLVTPEHVVPQILEALAYAIALGLRVPIVYNTSAYDDPACLALLDGVVDVYLPDVKLFDPVRSHRYIGVRDYPEVARAALAEMHRQVGDLHVDEDGVAVRGLLVRHLVMPGLLDDTTAILDFLADLSPDTYVNVMGQYRPAWRVASTGRYPEIARSVTRPEVTAAQRAARRVGLWRLDPG